MRKNELVDLGFEGLPWTWQCHWKDGTNIKERLDRILSSISWVNEINRAKVLHIENQTSDHSMVLLDTYPPWEGKKKKQILFSCKVATIPGSN